jgi:predicted Zn-dependent protease
LIDLYVKHDRRKEALEEFDRLPLDLPNREALRSAIRGACQAAKQNWTPALAYLQTAYSAGCRDLLCLRWLAVTLISTGETEAALPILRAWQAAEPRSAELQTYLAAVTDPLSDLPAPSITPAATITPAEPRRAAALTPTFNSLSLGSVGPVPFPSG